MKFQDLKKYLSIFILAVALIIVYNTFDNFGVIIDFFAKVLQLLTPFFIGAAIAFVLRIPCKKTEILLHKTKSEFLQKHRRGLSVAIVYLIVIAAIVLIMIAIIPQLVESIKSFIDQLPSIIRSVVNWINSFGIFTIDDISIQNILNSDWVSFDEILNIFDLGNVNKYAKGVINFGSAVVDIFLGIVISVYMLIDRKSIKLAINRCARKCLPEKFRRNIVFYTRAIASFIYRYISCQLLDACIVFILCLIVLSIMGTEYAAVIALMVGSFNLIPYFGAFVAITIAAIITLFTGGFVSALVLVAVLIVLQQVDANVIQPRLVSSSLSIRPLLVILGVILGGGLFGVVGMFIGVPVIALLKDIISDAVNNKHTPVVVLPGNTTDEE